MPRTPLPDVTCVHGLSIATTPGHVKHCHGATPADTVLLEDYFALRYGQCTLQDTVTLNRRLANTRHPESADSDYLSVYRPRSGTPSSTSRNHSVYSGSTLFDSEDNDDDTEEGDILHVKLIDGLQPCGRNARDSVDIVRIQYEVRRSKRRARMGRVRRVLDKLLH